MDIGVCVVCVRSRLFFCLCEPACGSRRAAAEEQQLAEDSDNEYPSMQADAALAEKELSALVVREVRKLPPRLQDVFALGVNHQTPYAEIGAVLQISASCARSHMTRALRALRKALADAGYTVPAPATRRTTEPHS